MQDNAMLTRIGTKHRKHYISGDYAMNCERCKLKYGPFAVIPILGNPFERDIDGSCKSLQLVRTDAADYYVCPKSGMPEGRTGFIPGHGYLGR
jgi:hypothetical protein